MRKLGWRAKFVFFWGEGEVVEAPNKTIGGCPCFFSSTDLEAILVDTSILGAPPRKGPRLKGRQAKTLLSGISPMFTESVEK